MQRPTTLSSIDIADHGRDPLEDHPLFTPDLEYFTPSTNISLSNTNAYQPRTLTPYNMERQAILPAFPPSPFFTNVNDSEPLLLLSSVPNAELSALQLTCRTPNAYLSSFELIEQHLEMIHPTKDSFIGSIYQQLLLDLSMKWNISVPILDYNLARLYQCTKRCLAHLQQQHRQEHLQLQTSLPSTATLPMEELASALEFYLQIDVDLFYFKTCSFRQAKPIEQTIFCSKSPEIRYHVTACNKSTCACCHPILSEISSLGQRPAIQFNHQGKHQFILGYQTLLNCPATCETNNIIYALTCPCEQFDYVGTTTMSFRDCLAMHREESNRIMREFILGPITTSRILQGKKSEETQRNDRMWLYQHTARCPSAVQLFLDANPDYWCFVPVANNEANSNINTRMRLSAQARHTQPTSTRLQAEAKYLADQVPDPPDGYVFTDRQKQGQIQFFRALKDQQLLSSSSITMVNLYNAAMIAVLPENCSALFQQLILSVFITHTDCDLNKTGRLIDEIVYREYPNRAYWCVNLVRRSLSSF